MAKLLQPALPTSVSRVWVSTVAVLLFGCDKQASLRYVLTFLWEFAHCKVACANGPMTSFDDSTPNRDGPAVAPDTLGAEHFRLFYVDATDKFRGVEVYSGASDTHALERARIALHHHPYAVAIEVWKRGVLVGHVDR